MVKTVSAVSIVIVTAWAVACGGASDDYARRMAREHADDAPVASRAAQTAPAATVHAKEVVYATLEGREVQGYLAAPAAGAEGAPGLLVIQEWWGLNDNIRAMARRLAGQGYVALAVDLYEGRVAETRDAAYELMTAAMAREEALEENLRQAHAWLRRERGAKEIGAIGWCFGGGWALRAGLLLGPELDAVVIYYGRLVTEPEALQALRAPVLGIFGGADRGIPLEGVRAFESALRGLDRLVEIHVYEGADHAFANPSGTRYDAEAAEDAWAKTLAFLETHLGN